ncbi:hypothetical protein ACHAXH_007977 [Discostella pseudostelligera]
MARSSSDNLDDGTSGAGEGSSYTYHDDAGYDNSFSKRRGGGGSSGSANTSNSIPILKQLFVGCEDDAPGSVHRAWAVTVMFMVIFFTVSITEARKLNDEATSASVALQIASYWSAILHLILAILGTFILKRFSTAFTVGCFLGVTVVVSQQNLLLFAAFVRYQHGNVVSNVIFAYLALALFLLLTFFSLILGHFRHYIIVK